MKNIYIILTIVIAFINNSCNNEEQSSELLHDKTNVYKAITRTSYIGGTISGEKKAYIGDGTYRYTLSFSRQNNPIGIKISAVGGEAKIKNPSSNRYQTSLTQIIPKGIVQYSFDVLWTKAEKSAVLMVRPYNSTIELNADLKDINIEMKPFTINAPKTFELGNAITFWCSYPLNKDTNIKWVYDKGLFSEITQSASVNQGKFQIDLKSIQPFKTSSIGVEVYDFFINVIGTKEYFLARKGNTNLFNIGPQISGNNSLVLYDSYTYQFNVSSDLTNIKWEENEYIRYISNKNQYSVQLNPIKAGKSTIRVSYNYKNSTEYYHNNIPITITSVFPSIIGNKNICYNTTQNLSIKNIPSQALVQWNTDGGTSPMEYTGNVFMCKNISSTIRKSNINATITLPSKYSFNINSYVNLFNPTAPFEKGRITDDAVIEADHGSGETSVSLYGYPTWATNFTWSSPNAYSIEVQGQNWTTFYYNSFEVWETEAEVKVKYQSPCGDWYEVAKILPIVRRERQ